MCLFSGIGMHTLHQLQQFSVLSTAGAVGMVVAAPLLLVAVIAQAVGSGLSNSELDTSAAVGENIAVESAQMLTAMVMFIVLQSVAFAVVLGVAAVAAWRASFFADTLVEDDMVASTGLAPRSYAALPVAHATPHVPVGAVATPASLADAATATAAAAPSAPLAPVSQVQQSGAGAGEHK